MRPVWLFTIPLALSLTALGAPSLPARAQPGPGTGPAHNQLQFNSAPGQLGSLSSPWSGWEDPRNNGGAILNHATTWDDTGEPLNVIISNQSSPDVLREHGFVAWARSLKLWNECANLHLGDPQFANLGDGGGWLPELFEMRESRWPFVGSCLESVVGGQHFRAWKQNGTLANSGAWFMAASKEHDVKNNHMIVQDGYNLGRDYVVETAIAGTRYRARSWTASVEWIEGLLPPGSEGVNHDIAQDGKVAVLTVIEY